MNCPSCQAALPQRANFCGFCGARLAETAAAAAPEPASFAPPVVHSPSGMLRGTGSLSSLPGDKPAAPPMGDRRVVTVLFTDVSGFTAMSERLDPEEVREIVNAFFRVLTEPIYRYGGIVDKYIGDAIMAIFGAPVAHEDDAERAVMAAWSMQGVAKAFAARVQSRVGTTLQIRVGLNTGLVVAGAVGGAQKQDYTVIGDTVNLAQRMETSCPLGHVLVTQETFKLTAQRFAYSEGTPIKVKGRKEPVIAYVLGGPREGGSAYRDRIPLVGRQLEIAELREALHRALQGSPQVVSLIGETGMGKSRLSREFIGEFAAQSLGRVVGGRALSYAEETSDVLIQNLIYDLLGLPPSPTPDEVLGRARTELARLLPATDDYEVAILAHLLGIEHPHPAVDALAPPQRKAGAFSLVNDLLITLAEEAPVVLDLDDLHWADPSSLEWLRSMLVKLEEKADLPLIVLLQFRPSTDKDFSEDVGPPRANIELGPLEDSDCWQLVRVVLSDGDAGDLSLEALQASQARAFLEQVIRRSGGNPFFLTELLTSLIENGALARGAQGWEVRGVTGEITLPTSLSGITAARLDRLPAEQRRILQVASVAGRDFVPELIEQLTGLENISGLLAELILDDLLTIQDNGSYAFIHGIFQEVAYQSLLISARRDLHGQVAAALEEAMGPNPEHPQVLARHYSLAELPDKALHYLYLTGERARGEHRLPEAVACLTQVLRRLEEPEPVGPPIPGMPAAAPASPPSVEIGQVLLSLGECEIVLGQFAQAQDHLEQAYRRTPSPRQAALLLTRLADVLERQGDFDGAIERLNEALQAIQAEPDPVVHGRVLAAMAAVKMRLGQYEAAIKECQAGLAMLEEDNRAERAQCYSVLGLCAHRLGDFERSAQAHIRALSLREHAGDTGGVAKSLNNLGTVYSDSGDWRRAYECYTKSLNFFRRIGDRGYMGMVLNNLGHLHKERGELDLAETHFREALKLERGIGDLRNAGVSLVNLGDTLMRARRLPEALSVAQEGIAIFESIPFREGAVEPFKVMGEILLEMGDRDGAEKALREAEIRASAAGNQSALAAAYRAFSRLHQSGGNLDRAEEFAERAVGMLDERTNRLEIARARAQRAAVLRDQGREEEASRIVEEVGQIFEALGAKP